MHGCAGRSSGLPCGLMLTLAVVIHGGCGGSAGNHLVTFRAAAAGPAGATHPLTFVNDAGYQITLTAAMLHMGAAYLNQTRPLSGAQATSCVLPGVYVGQVVRGLDVDLLSAEPQPFPVAGEGTDLPARAGEVWLTHGDVNQVDDALPMLRLDGTATRSPTRDDAGAVGVAVSFAFTATLTIGANRRVPAPSAVQPGASPICKQRIVTPIPVDLTLADGGRLMIRADPRVLLAGVDFALDFPPLTAISDPPTPLVFDDLSQTHASRLLYTALRSTAVYRFEWISPTPTP